MLFVFSFLFVGCEFQKEPGKPFAPIELPKKSKKETPAPPIKQETKEKLVLDADDFDDEPTKEKEVTTKSDKNQNQVAKTDKKSKPQIQESQSDPPLAVLPISSQYPINNPPTLPPSPYAFSLQDWPIIVIDTSYNLNPPRALLGLPTGEEVSVQAGQMLPKYNLVVMAIGTKTVDFVRISQIGSQTKVEPLQLVAQN